MLKDLKHTIKHSAVYGLSRVAGKGLSFVFIPLYTAVYTPDLYANINLLETFWQYIYTLCLFGFETTIITHCSTETEDNRKKLLFNFFSILAFNCFFFLSLGVLFKDNLSYLILKQHGYENVIFYCFLISIFESLLALPLCIARLKNKPGLYSAIALSSLFLNFFMQIYFVYFQKKDLGFIFISKFIAPLIIFVLCIPFIIKNVKINFNKTYIKDIVAFSFFWTLYAILSMLLNTVDRYILNDFVSKEQVAIYTLGYGVAGIINFIVVMPFTLAFSGIFYQKIKEENAERYFTKISTYLFFTLILVSLCIALIIPEAIKLFARNPKLWDAISTIKIILLANSILGLFNIVGFGYLYKKESKVVTWFTFIVLIFNIAGNFIFIKYYGIYAAGILSVLSNLLLIVILYLKSKSYYFIKLESYKLFLLSIIYIGLVILSPYIKQDSLVINGAIDIILVIAFFILLYIGRFFENAELYAIKGAINKYLKINLFRKTS